MATVRVESVSIEAERFGGGRTPWVWVAYAPAQAAPETSQASLPRKVRVVLASPFTVR